MPLIAQSVVCGAPPVQRVSVLPVQWPTGPMPAHADGVHVAAPLPGCVHVASKPQPVAITA
jgi:hypothetical protein